MLANGYIASSNLNARKLQTTSVSDKPVSPTQLLPFNGWGPATYLAAAFCCCALLVPLGGEALFAVTALLGCYKLAVPTQRKRVFDNLQIDKQDLL